MESITESPIPVFPEETHDIGGETFHMDSLRIHLEETLETPEKTHTCNFNFIQNNLQSKIQNKNHNHPLPLDSDSTANESSPQCGNKADWLRRELEQRLKRAGVDTNFLSINKKESASTTTTRGGMLQTSGEEEENENENDIYDCDYEEDEQFYSCDSSMPSSKGPRVSASSTVSVTPISASEHLQNHSVPNVDAPMSIGHLLLLGIRVTRGVCLQSKSASRSAPALLVRQEFCSELHHLPVVHTANGVTQFKFTEVAPRVFLSMRERAGIDEDAFSASLCEAALLETENTGGKSGARLLHSCDERFIIKELKRSEKETLINLLPAYHAYLLRNPYSLLPRFFGCFTIWTCPELGVVSHTHFVVMHNILYDDDGFQFQEVYDLKGSVRNRFTSSPFKPGSSGCAGGLSTSLQRSASLGFNALNQAHHRASSPSPIMKRHASVDAPETPTMRRTSSCTKSQRGSPIVLKDLNLMCKFMLSSPSVKNLFIGQLERDAKFLESQNIMDYSALIGVKEVGKENSAVDPNVSKDDAAGAGAGSCNASPSVNVSNLSEVSNASSEPTSELGAIFRRVSAHRREMESLVPVGVEIRLGLIGHCVGKRSRSSRTVFRQNATIYTWRVTRQDSNEEWLIYRRYKDFLALERDLKEELDGMFHIPALPAKKAIGFMGDDFVRKREAELHRWLSELLRLMDFQPGDSPAFQLFLTKRANAHPHSARQILHKIPNDLDPSSDPLQGGNVNLNLTHESALGGKEHRNIEAKRLLQNKAVQKVCLNVGVIDILQEYNLSKKIESAYKGLRTKPEVVSAIDPASYNERFISFMRDYVFR